jgi:modulator of FtsH protease
MLPNRTVINTSRSELATNTVIRNTWLLLSLTLLFSAGTAFLGTIHPPAMGGLIATFIAGFILLFVTQMLRNSGWGILCVFAFTGCMGYSMGPMLNQFIRGYTNGGQLILTSLAATGTFFFVSSAWIVTTKRDLSGWGKTLMIGLIVCVFAGLANLFLHMSAMQLAISSMMVVISACLMMYDTSRIIHNGETNYIMATISLYLDILMLFQNLLILLGEFSGNRK